jgi:hypothetical protein
MLVSSIPNAFVASQVKSAESVRSVCLILRSERTPFGSISSRIVYLQENTIKNKLQQTLSLWRKAMNMKCDSLYCIYIDTPRRRRQHENIKSTKIQIGFNDEDVSLLEYAGMSTDI